LSPSSPARKPARPAPSRTTRSTTSHKRFPIAIVVGAVVAVALVAVIVIFMGSEKPTDVQTCIDLRIDEGYTPQDAEVVCNTLEVGAPTVTGESLPEFARGGNDPALGLAIPQVAGADFDGNPVAINTDGRAKVIMFFAHWCSVCRQELPLIADWLPTATFPDNVDLISVSAGVDITAANYPPSAWMADEGWTVPVILDDDADTVLNAFGITAFPAFVFVNADGTVFLRFTGAMATADLATIISTISQG
jgi:cytochrome c biogenesis protein CcmG, thiol:disulfide interchange protein DsbE